MYSELKSVEQPLIKTLQKLGWEYISATELDKSRTSYNDIFVEPLLKESLLRLNSSKGLTEKDATELIRRLKRFDDDEEFHNWLKGDQTYKPTPDANAISITLIDEDNIDNNRFIVTSQYSCAITKPEDNRKEIRPDVVLLVNGIPLCVIECKFLGTAGSTFEEGLKQIRRYQRVCPELFSPNGFNITTDGYTLKYGATGAPDEYYFEWKDDTGTPPEIKSDSEFKKLAEEDKQNYNPFIDDQVFGLCSKRNFLDLCLNFIVFEVVQNKTIKKVARYQQFRATNKIVERVAGGEMKSGLVWHTQGSGKSLTMLFTAWKLRRMEQLNNPTVLIVVDRVDLDDQISSTFEAVKMPNTSRASSISNLRSRLLEDTREVIISTVFKFSEMKDILIERDNIIILIDEAHRSQEGMNAAEMRKSLKNAYFFGFTGTPIDKSDHNTHRNFGLKPDGSIERYMDLYNIRQAIDDGATVPVHYQLRNTKWHMKDDEVDAVVNDIYSDLPEEELVALRDKASAYSTFMLKPERLKSISDDIAVHYRNSIEPNGFKAQVVCYNRKACVKMKEYLDLHFKKDLSEVVFSAGHNDDVDLIPHHKSKDEIKKVVKKFVKGDSDLKILIVQNMLLTGFDAPVEQVMYLDRPLKDHSLLQAIARTNRPYPNKKCGIIIDYCGVLKNLNKALNFDESEVADCLIDFDKLKDDLPKDIEAFKELISGANIDNYSQTIKYIQDNGLEDDLKKAYKKLEITFETLSPDPFVVDHNEDYVWATKVMMVLSSISTQEKPKVNQEYLAHTRKIIQEHIDLSEISQRAPVFVVDDNYLRKLDGTGLNKEEKELTLENRLRSFLRVKSNDLPVYKTLQEKLESIISQKNEATSDTLSLLEELTNEVVEAQKEEEALGLSKGEMAIRQILTTFIDDQSSTESVADALNEKIMSHTDGFENWQLQPSIIGKIKSDIIIGLIQAGQENNKINIDPDDLSGIATEMIKFIEMYY